MKQDKCSKGTEGCEILHSGLEGCMKKLHAIELYLDVLRQNLKDNGQDKFVGLLEETFSERTTKEILKSMEDVDSHFHSFVVFKNDR